MKGLRLETINQKDVKSDFLYISQMDEDLVRSLNQLFQISLILKMGLLWIFYFFTGILKKTHPDLQESHMM